MATSISSVQLTLNLKTIFENTYGITTNSRTTDDTLSLNLSDTLADGELVNQADFVWHDEGTLSNTTRDIDLYGGLTDAFGNTINAKVIKCVLVHNKNTTAGQYLDVGGDANSVPIFVNASDIVRVHPDGIFFLWNPSAAGYAVTAATGDIIQLDSTGSGANISYEIVIIGTYIESSASASPSASISASVSSSVSSSASASISASTSASISSSVSSSASASISSSAS